MELLAQFLLRLAFGLAVGMAITSPRKVSSGFFRNHLYVTLGLATLAALVLAQARHPAAVARRSAAAALSFVGAACLAVRSEAPRARLMLWLVAALRARRRVIGSADRTTSDMHAAGRCSAIVTSGLVLGLVFAAMLLGHWYLNAPGMELAPLRRLLIAAARRRRCASARRRRRLGRRSCRTRPSVIVGWLLFVVLRWSFGLFGVLGAAVDGVANAQNSQHAKRHRHPLCGRDRRFRRRIDGPATVGRSRVSPIIELSCIMPSLLSRALLEPLAV